MARSSSVSLEEKMDELELGGKMRKSHDMRQSEMNLAQQQLVGFGMLPDQVTASGQEVVTLMVMVLQVYSKAVRKGFEFSLMVVGASGLGKSTLVNSMFLTDIYRLVVDIYSAVSILSTISTLSILYVQQPG